MRGQLRQQDVVLVPARDQRARAFREARRTGILSLPARNLNEFPTEVYHLEEHLDKDEKKWECIDLVKIDLSHNAIATISDEIAGLSTVTSIKLTKNALQVLPQGFFELHGLAYLDLSHNQLQQDLPESFGCLVSLEELVLSGNKLNRLPSSITHLQNLKVLHIDENALTALPEHIGNLQKLHVLNAHTNQLSMLPISFRALKNMRNLDLKKNQLASTNDALATLPHLKFLDLRQNRLVVFPILPDGAALDQIFLGYNILSKLDAASILRVKDSVTVLDICDNKLAKLPANIVCLYRLKTLNLANNDLSDLPPGLGYLKNLNHFSVDGNPLRAIRRSVISGGCESLKRYLRTRGAPPPGVEEERDDLQMERERLAEIEHGSEILRRTLNYTAEFQDAAALGTLALMKNHLEMLPSGLVGQGQFNFGSTLKHLNLSSNKLQSLPASISELVSLETLTVDNNELQFIHPSIAALRHLKLLRLRKNRLSEECISQFLGDSPAIASTLKEIDLRNNRLSAAPVEICLLRSLEILLLAFNRIEALDHFPWSLLEKVTLISLSDNKLRSLGRIYDAPQLASLSFENNNLTNVPYELGLCPYLRKIDMNGNPQRTVRGGVLAKGSAEILAFLKNKLPPNSLLLPPSPIAAPRTLTSVPTRLNEPLNRMKKAVYGGEQSLDKSRASHGAVTTQGKGSVNENSVESLTPLNTTAAIKLEIAELSARIAQLEIQLDDHALSAPKRFALRKDLAMMRSKKIRKTRKL